MSGRHTNDMGGKLMPQLSLLTVGARLKDILLRMRIILVPDEQGQI